jgi:hypothetical protein
MLRMEAACSAETLVPIKETAWSHIPEEHNLDAHRRENLKYDASIANTWIMCWGGYQWQADRLTGWLANWTGGVITGVITDRLTGLASWTLGLSVTGTGWQSDWTGVVITGVITDRLTGLASWTLGLSVTGTGWQSDWTGVVITGVNNDRLTG